MSNRIRYIMLWIISVLSWPYRWWLRRRLQRRVGRVMVIRPDHLGDLLFASAALLRLRAGLAGKQILLAVGPWNAEAAARYVECYDLLMTIPFAGFTRQEKGGLLAPYRMLWHEARQLRRWQREYGRIDLGVNLRFDFWWGGLLCLLAGIPLLGYDTPLLRLVASKTIPYQKGKHEVEQNLLMTDFVNRVWGQVVDTAAMPYFPLTEAERNWAAAWLQQQGWHEGERLIIIHPGAGDRAKQWPSERWAEVVSFLLKELDCWILLTGSIREEHLCAKIGQAQPENFRKQVINAAGQTNLGELAALMTRAELVMGVDSGPLHLASTLERPTLRLFGPSDAQIWGPWPPDARRNKVIKAERITNIDVATVTAAAQAWLNEEQGHRAAQLLPLLTMACSLTVRETKYGE